MITDILMPGEMDGLALANYAKEKYSNLNILLISGFPDEALKMQNSNDFNFKLLPKPFSRVELQLAIENCLSV